MKAHAAIIAVLVMLLTGCAQFRQLPQIHIENADYDYYWIRPGQAHASSKVAALLYYADYVRNLGATEYAQEVEHARLLYTQEKSDFRLLQYVLALLAAHNRDANKVQQLIEPLLKGNKTADPELVALARFLDSDLAENLAERRRLEAEIKRAEEVGKRAEEAAKRAEAESKRADELEKQVEAIKNIEKKMIERGKSGGGKK